MYCFEVLSFNPKTLLAEQVSFENRADAEAHQERAQREGRLQVEIVESPEEHLEWAQRANDLKRDLSGS